MKNAMFQSMKIAAIVVAMSVSPLARADEVAPTPPEPFQPPRDVIVVRPDAPSASYTARLHAPAAPSEMREQKMVKAAFLGVGVSNAPEVLTEQLKLPQGVGLVVEFVEKDSPAENAGIQPRDLLHKLNDQLLINVQQLATLVRTFKPGEGVEVTLIRKGEVLTLDATLVEKELPELSSAAQQFEFSTVPGFPSLVPGQMPQIHVDALPGEVGKARIIRVMPNATSKIIKVDDDGLRVELESQAGKKTLRIQDADGKSLFDGAYNTDEEKAKVPPELREKVEALEEGIKLKEVPATSPTEPKASGDDVLTTGPTT